jgi:hypothetical protein
MDNLIEIDDFIKNNKETDDIFCKISSRDLKNGKKIYNKMKEIQNTSYQIFGGNGYVSYGLYRSKEQIIYLIKVNIQTVIDYTIVDLKNEYYFDL